MKYINAEKLKEEIEKRRKFHDDAVIKFYNNRTIALTHSAGLKEDEELIELIDSLQQEQPEVDLEEEVRKYCGSSFRFNYDELNDSFYSNAFEFDDVVELARHFYELGFNARKA